jgi:transposase InsO family protein
MMCRVLKVSTSGYYGWKKRKPSERDIRKAVISKAVFQSHISSYGIYGHRKVHKDVVQDFKINCCKETIRRIMLENGLTARQRRKFVKTTDSNHSFPVADNILGREFETDAPNKKWVADITYIRTLTGWLYLSIVLDLYSRRIVGWSMSETINASLACDALKMALLHRCPGSELLFHSDRGSQYASFDFKAILDVNGIICSMSRKGNCWDNACAERFFKSLKTEWIGDGVYRNESEAKDSVFEYIEMFYNRQRRHETLGYVSPADFEACGAS